MSGNVFAFLFAILIVAALVLLAIVMTKKQTARFDKEKYQIDFLAIENGLDPDNPATFALAIINGDKILDRALCEMGVAGKTMGERLKRCGKDKFTKLNAVWYVHKIRNQIAHEPDFQPDFKQARRALSVYKQALKDLGAV